MERSVAWLREIIGAAQLVANEALLRKAWIRGEQHHTALRGFDEFYARLFRHIGIIDLSEVLDGQRADNSALVEAVEEFMNRFMGTYFWSEAALGVGEVSHFAYAEALLDSEEWRKLLESARSVVFYAEQSGVSAMEFSPPD